MKSGVSKLDKALSEYEKDNPIMNDADLISAIEAIRNIELLKPGDACDFDLIEEATEELHLLHEKNLITIKREVADFSSHHFDELKKRAENQTKTKKRITVKWIIPVAAIVFVLFTVLAVSLGINRSCARNDNPGGLSTSSESEWTMEFYFPEKGKAERLSFIDNTSPYFFSSITDYYQKADVVMLGNVIDELPDFSADHQNHVLSLIKIDSVWKGNVAEGDEIVVDEIGERLGNGIDKSLRGEPLLRKGMKVILLLSVNRNGNYEIYKGSQGKFFLDNHDFVYSCGFFIDLPNDVPIPSNEKKIPLDEFKEVLDTLK